MKALLRKAKEGSAPKKGVAVVNGYSTQASSDENPGVPIAPDSLLTLPAQPVVVEERHRIAGIPSVFLVEEWLPVETEVQLIAHLRARAKEFVQLRGKRTARFGGLVGNNGEFDQEPLPPFLEQLCSVVGTAGFPETIGTPNHVLVNHYQPGEGIMPHTDGPAYEPLAASLSLCSAVTFNFWCDHAHSTSGRPPALSVLLPPRSLLIFQEEAYTSHLHSVADRLYDELDPAQRERFERAEAPMPAWASRQLLEGSGTLKRQERYSLTIRRVAPADA